MLVLTAKQITDDLRKSFRGRLAFDPLTCGVHSTDASPFRITPLGVAFPEDADDLAVLVKYAFRHGLPLVPRGAGTGVAGESLGPGLVVDLSRNFRQILAIDDATATVQPGVVLAELNAELAQRGRRFAPDPSSAASCTLGGMIATNASGGNAYRFGYVRDHIAAVKCLWDNGTASDDGTRTAEIVSAAEALLVASKELIEERRPRTPFDRCGYRLHDVFTDGRLDLAKLMTGSEGTLGFITSATLRTVPLAGGTCLAMLGFPTLESALKAAWDLKPFDPVGCDLLDRRLLASTRAPSAVAAALVFTFEADTEREALDRGTGAIEKLKESHRLLVLAEPAVDPDGLARIRTFRKDAVDGLYGIGRGPRPMAFIEDVGVPAESLPDFIARTQDALQAYELSASFLVHALTGQVHTRPMVDLELPEHREKLWPVAEAVHGIALSLGGTVSSQHGTGTARTPWVERQAGPLFNVFRELKRIFDPKNLLNPGKIVGPDPSRPAWPLRLPEPAAERVPLLLWKDGPPTAEAKKCTGCAECRPHAPSGRMCPAFRADGSEDASPRAMSRLFELAPGEKLGEDDAFALARKCINCKMCRDECPSHVNVPKLMLEAKAAHHAAHGLERADWFLAKTEGLAWLAGKFSPFTNRLIGTKSGRWLLEKLVGVSRRRRLPSFAWSSFSRRPQARPYPPRRRHRAQGRLLHRRLRKLQRPADRGSDGGGVEAQRRGSVRSAAPDRVRRVRTCRRRHRDRPRGRTPQRPRARRPRARRLPRGVLGADRGADAVAGLSRVPGRSGCPGSCREHGRTHDVPRRTARGRRTAHGLRPARSHARPPRALPLEGAPRPGPRPRVALQDPRLAGPHHRRELLRDGGNVGAQGGEL
ncbi:MAG: FAD-linked oxidase C-terminal domain-containing protein [Gemmataceae bacterium]